MNPRIRTVKPEFFKHEELLEAESKEQLPLRLAFIALWTCCDREGRFRWQPSRLKLDMLPYDEVDFSRVLDALAFHGFIKKYEYEGKYYGCIPSWKLHQQINNKEAASILPSLQQSILVEVKKITDANGKNSFKNNEVTNQSAITPTLTADLNDASLTRGSRVKDACREDSRGREREGNGKGKEEEGNRSIVASETRQVATRDSVEQVFEHWKTVMGHPSARLDDKRKGIIKKALNSGYSVEQLCDAITGCSLTPHNMGDNERGQRYDGLQVILRDSDQIDRFMRNCYEPPCARTEPERRTQANIHTLQRWINQKMQEGETHAKA